MRSYSTRLRHYSFSGIVKLVVHWTFKCPFVQWTNRNGHWTCIQMSIRPVDEQKCPWDISICPFVHWTNGHILMSIRRTEMPIGHSNVHSSNGRMDANGHCLMASTLVSYPHGVRLSQITSLTL